MNASSTLGPSLRACAAFPTGHENTRDENFFHILPVVLSTTCHPTGYTYGPFARRNPQETVGDNRRARELAGWEDHVVHYDANPVLYNIVHVEDGEVYGVVWTIFLEQSQHGDNDYSSCNQRRQSVSLRP